ncbi:MAG TPA: hypothetical protein VKM55_11400 [Candidatus Lokiarchaeia archaeon]|nr:hypothetical protein [Candidatus Lokiarchaeia archaeon]
MLYNESDFVGKEKKHFLTAFPGKIDSIKKQASGNIIVVLTAKAKDGVIRKREAIFRKIEIETYELAELLKDGKSISVFGIFTRKKTIFPVCFLKVKVDGEIRTIEIAENLVQYKILMEQLEKSTQTDLDTFK